MSLYGVMAGRTFLRLHLFEMSHPTGDERTERPGMAQSSSLDRAA
jgi:hypothetical protein